MAISPIELGNRIEFLSGDGRVIYVIPISELQKVYLTSEKKGRLIKSNNFFVNLSYYKDGYVYQMKIDFPNFHAVKIVEQLEKFKKIDITSYFQKYTLGYRSRANEIKNVEIYPMSPYLDSDEQLAWYSLKTSGIMTKKADWIQAITSFRILEYNFSTHQCASIPLPLLDSAIVTNRRTLSQTSQSGLFVGSGPSAAVLQANASTTSVTVGDVTFTSSGKNLMTIHQVQDPDGVASVFNSTRSVILSEEEYARYLDNRTVEPSPETVENSCPSCRHTNPQHATFCNECGEKLVITCLQCGAGNPIDSSFCNKCGINI